MALPSVGSRKIKGKFKVTGGMFSADELKDKFSRSGQGLFIFLKDGESVRIRFLAEPNKWRLFSDHRAKKGGNWTTVPCISDVCPLDDDDQPSQKVLIPVYDVKQKKIRIVKAGSRLFDDLIGVHGRGKLLDRDYNLLREGSELDTKYILDAEDKEQRPELKKLTLPDLDKILEDSVSRYYDMDTKKKSDKDDDNEEKKVPKKKGKRKDEDEEEDDDVELEEDDDEEDDDDEDEDEDEESDDDDDDDDDEDEEDEKPAKKKSKVKPKKKAKDEDEEEDDEDESEDEDDDEDEDDEESEEEEEGDDEDDEDEDPPAKPKKLKAKAKDKAKGKDKKKGKKKK